jgi:hypothetical protein
LGSKEGGEFLDQLSDCQLLKKECDSWGFAVGFVCGIRRVQIFRFRITVYTDEGAIL